MDPQPNENGVYSKGDAECLSWPGTKDARCYAEIYVLEVDGVWLAAHSYGMGGTDMRGGGGPLMKSDRQQHATRHDAITFMANRLLGYIKGSDCKGAPSIRIWLGDLLTGPVQADLFSQAA